MQIVINIPEETYQDVVKNGFIYDEDGEVISHAIINGTPLHKIHEEIESEGAYINEVKGKCDFLDGIEYCLAVIEKYIKA